MRHQHARQVSRRRFLGGLTLLGTTGFLGLYPRSVAAEPPPETTKLRLGHATAICVAPLYVAAELLPGEGFTEVQYIRTGQELFAQAMAAGEIDIALNFSGPLLPRLEAGDPLVILAGAHVGCFELFGADHVRAIRDLKGKTVAITQLGGPDHVFLASILAYVGVNPREDIHWVIHPFAESMPFLAEGKIDAVLAFPPRPQELRAQGIGHVVLNSSVDRPWSQYFCCMVYANREFVRKHPMATKRVLRAILKANAICSLEPERVARFLVDAGYTRTYEYALETIKDIGYNRWREYEAEDTIRFYALRLQEAGMIKATPQKLIAQGTDWRFLNELKKELKG